MALRHNEDGARRLMQRLQEEAEAKRSIAGRLYPTKLVKQGQVHGWERPARAFTVQEAQQVLLGGKRRSETATERKVRRWKSNLAARATSNGSQID